MDDVTAVRVPHENVNDESVMVVAWLVADGQQVQPGQALAELQGSKANFEVYAPNGGYVRHSLRENEEVAVGGVLCTIAPKEPTPSPPETARLVPPAAAINTGAAEGVCSKAFPVAPPPPQSPHRDLAPASGAATLGRLSKAARQLLQEKGLDEGLFAGRGLVRARDVLDYLGGQRPAEVEAATPADQALPAPRADREPVPAHGVPYRTQALSRNKRTEIGYLRSAHRHTLPSCVSVAVPTRGFRAAAERHPDLPGGVTSIILYEAARLLRKYPCFNAFYAGGEAAVYEQVNVGFALDAGQGLKVPVLREADTKGLAAIAAEMRELLVQYLNGDLPVAALAGATFTVTDLSGEGVLEFVPRLNQGQAAILGVGAEFFVPGQAAGVYKLILAFDHQLAEGRQAARFLNDLRQRLRAYETALCDPLTFGGPAGEGPCCADCLRPVAELRELGAALLQTVRADGAPVLRCSLCVAGF
jgi:2-oxoglutarate dehydrogenase E2 component (dihydrolipoamide succinyltransferase)